MRSRFEAYIDRIPLSTLHPQILITDIGYTVANYKRQTQAVANRNGLILVNARQETSKVTIAFELRLYRAAERQVVLQKIQQWARGSVLETSDREGQQLHVVCDGFPTIGSVSKWNSSMTISFTAYEQPFWENKTPSIFADDGTEITGNLFVPGNAGETYVEAEITPSEAITGLVISVGSTSIELESLNTAEKITIGYDAYGNQYIKAGTTSILSKRTPESSDDLIAICGAKNAIAVTADKSVHAKIIARGLWL